MSQIFLILVVFVWCGPVNSWIITDFNKALLEKHMQIDWEKYADSGSKEIALIYPGTKWCGAGNIAENFDDLGRHRETDQCCRAHDHCPDVIEGGDSKHNLTNYAVYTRLACECDELFRKCLRKANKLTANIIGTIYFDGLNTQCFKKDFPATGCVEKGGLLHSKCLKYEYAKGRKKYQWFDVPLY